MLAPRHAFGEVPVAWAVGLNRPPRVALCDRTRLKPLRNDARGIEAYWHGGEMRRATATVAAAEAGNRDAGPGRRQHAPEQGAFPSTRHADDSGEAAGGGEPVHVPAQGLFLPQVTAQAPGDAARPPRETVGLRIRPPILRP